MILNAEESAQLNNGSTAAVTFNIAPASLNVADSLYSHVFYTVTPADYVAVTGNTYGDFSAGDVNLGMIRAIVQIRVDRHMLPRLKTGDTNRRRLIE